MIIPAADRIEGISEYYFSTKLQEIRQMRRQKHDVINLGIGNPDMMPDMTVCRKLASTVFDSESHGYQSYRGLPELREGISKWLDRVYGVELNPKTEILPLIGSKEGIMHISMAFLNKADSVLVPNPGYPAYSAVAKLVGARIITYNLDECQGWQPDVKALEKQDLSKVKLMWLSYPNMPTGSSASPKLFESLIQLAKKYRFLLVNDNPYSLILNDRFESLMSVSGAKEVALELNSLSKSHNMAGWRLGWVAGIADYINAILKVKSNMDSGMFKPLQLAAIQALQSPLSWHEQRNKIYSKRRKYAWKIMDALGCTYDKKQVGLFVWAKIPEHIKEVEAMVDNILYQAHVFITPGFIFGTAGQRHIRISLCSKIELFQEALTRILVYLSK